MNLVNVTFNVIIIIIVIISAWFTSTDFSSTSKAN